MASFFLSFFAFPARRVHLREVAERFVETLPAHSHRGDAAGGEEQQQQEEKEQQEEEEQQQQEQQQQQEEEEEEEGYRGGAMRRRCVLAPAPDPGAGAAGLPLSSCWPLVAD